MTVPGSNLLNIALGAIRPQKVGYWAWQSRTPNAAGKFDDVYAPRVDLIGSFQPVSRDRVQMLGLDVSKSYATLYASAISEPVSRDRGADRYDYAGRMYAALGNVDWFAQDGWQGVMLVDVGNDLVPTPHAGVTP